MAEEIGLEEKIKAIQDERMRLVMEETQVIDAGLSSKDPMEVIKAMKAIEITKDNASDDRKAFYVDPLTWNDEFGYKRRPTYMSYDVMDQMAITPIINAIHKRRMNQVAEFSRPQKDRHSTGFVIRKKGFYAEEEKKLKKEDRARIDEATQFILDCGEGSSWERDPFDTFLRKGTKDSLTFDQLNYEVVRNNGGGVSEFLMTPPETIRRSDLYKLARQGGAANHIPGYDPFRQKERVRKTMRAGYLPHAVQVYMEKVVAELYPWELEFALRNPTNRIHSNGYGRSELEDMVMVTTSLLWSDQYNQNFFRIGSSPKGILRVKGGSNNGRLEEFRQKWKSMVSGVQNSHRVPVIDSDTAEWIDLQKSHRDMEFSQWQEYNVKLACALYTIDPSEIGFDGHTQGGAPLFESNNASRLQFSRDNGLSPLLAFWEASLNKMIISQRYPDLVLEFVGLRADSEEQYNKKVMDEVKTRKTVNEIRAENNQKPLEYGDIILDPVYMQAMQAAKQQEMMDQQNQGDQGDGQDFGDMGQEDTTDGRGFTPREDSEEDNPFVKGINQYLLDFEKGRI